MRTALICGKWKLNFVNELTSEASKDKKNRSYLHYVLEHQPMVAAKAWATHWLFSALSNFSTVTEYLSGCGIQTVIIRGIYDKIENHKCFEINPDCVIQVSSISGVISELGDCFQKMLDDSTASDLVLLDFPSFTAMDFTRRRRVEIYKVFQRLPKYVAITDTSVSKLGFHRGRYSEILGGEIISRSDYARVLSKWLFNQFGYSITRAAWRGNNAGYFLIAQGMHKIEEKPFPIKSCANGFQWL